MSVWSLRKTVGIAVSLASTAAAAAEFDCMIEPKRVVAITGPVEALIAGVRVERGDYVNRGDVLVEFDAGVERSTVELAKARALMTSSVAARQARYDHAALRATRRGELSRQNYVSKQDFDEAEAERRMAEAELREAKDNLRLADLEHRRASELLRQRTLRSPVTGIVIERLMHPGEVSELGKKPILKLAEIDQLHVEVILPIGAYGTIAPGASADVRPEKPVGGTYAARVVVVDKVVDGSSATFGVRLELPNPQRKLPAGVRCRIEFQNVATHKSAKPAP
jgi:RND family efflux transporter MFP subunit